MQSDKRAVTPIELAVRALTGAAGFLHDVGKLSLQFQHKLKEVKIERDGISHEWISAWICQRMLRAQRFDIASFEQAWNDWERAEDGVEAILRNDLAWCPFEQIADFDSALLMVIATHHRLFSRDSRPETKKGTCKKAKPTRPELAVSSPPQNHVDADTSRNQRWECTDWKSDAVNCQRWEHVLRLAQVQCLSGAGASHDQAFWHKAALMARAALILADHHVSSEVFADVEASASYTTEQIYANTTQSGGGSRRNQPLSWHLEQVGVRAMAYARAFETTDLPALSGASRERLNAGDLRSPTRFAWQGAACEFVAQIRDSTPGRHAFLIFNVAGTGSGKTRASMRVLEACQPVDKPVRVTAGFNLKSLTLQTASTYRHELGLGADECACVIGDPLARALHAYEQINDDTTATPEQFMASGCDSAEFLAALPDWLQQWQTRSHDQSMATLIAAPILVATMDYLVAAGEPNRQAHHAHALLRIAHSDLLIDEADSYDPHALVAVLRLVQLAAAFGRNVLVASATLSPVLAEAIEMAWQSGRQMLHSHEPSGAMGHTVLVSNHGAERGSQAEWSDRSQSFMDWYRQQMAQAYLRPQPIHRLAKILPIEQFKLLTKTVLGGAQRAHKSHHWLAKHPSYSKTVRVSIGLVRMANVDPLMHLANALAEASAKAPPSLQIKVCAYHAREIAMRRALKEQTLDALLKRHGDRDLADDAAIQVQLKELSEEIKDLVLIVLASPVEEIGRDHDFDWAIAELSSSHALIQLAGRVNRHRLVAVEQPNVFVLEKNIKALRDKRMCFTKPGLQLQDKNAADDVPLTHTNSSARHLLAPINGPVLNEGFAIDAGLVFDPSRRCHFAQEDDRAIAHLLSDARPFLLDDSSHWACDWFYKAFQLREPDAQTLWRVASLVNGKLRLEQYEPTRSGSAWIAKDGSAHETRPNFEVATWLCPSVDSAEHDFATLLQAFPSREQGKLLELGRQVSVRKERPPTITWAGACM
ncbi:hypothetical protein E9531_04495 [Lampropedia puyangensis]|uniref:HD Cas3-type domain-containing protein n=1 Tax=Lampropedia puyangensis TaxID=1330072 RepID=A0A4S8FAD7_9BURK|nr:hypothetical protein [Lampropedia puyangensis]THU03991.1 hypothetical protein E9531_04495 [Lampropedia puyangensis]